ncbi:histidine phosphatase family protein [Pleurocapsa sp. CCALA 161]|uniref:histidine phosphatase family protein n=1 Tax=Pleurocapsa sp. CCALA 161 TaxID=2107688 RepID=UPI000D083127|nr:histidine phosphatase family protein [Pleurocapsa sp. CCALA 161]PSB10972.1 histidine phosphatase family protein [Pleurocapsa sp. CCALA 161]
MPQTVWIARHGNRLDFINPEWFNTATRRYDPPLSEDGFIQAAELGQRLKSEKIKHLFVSPFLRTIQTANEVAQIMNLEMKLEAGLSEWHNSQWMTQSPEIHPQEFLATAYPAIDWSYQSQIYPQYPETKADVNRRTAATIKQLLSQYDEDILIVGHGASVFGVTQGLVANIPDAKIALCSLTKVVGNVDNWNLEFYADTSHLSQTESQVRLN